MKAMTVTRKRLVSTLATNITASGWLGLLLDSDTPLPNSKLYIENIVEALETQGEPP